MRVPLVVVVVEIKRKNPRTHVHVRDDRGWGGRWPRVWRRPRRCPDFRYFVFAIIYLFSRSRYALAAAADDDNDA